MSKELEKVKSAADDALDELVAVQAMPLVRRIAKQVYDVAYAAGARDMQDKDLAYLRRNDYGMVAGELAEALPLPGEQT